MTFNDALLSLFLFSICVWPDFSNSTVLTGSIKVCEELDQPTGWSIKDLKDVNLYAWPWKCLNSRYSNDSLLEAIVLLSADVVDATEKNYKGFVQYFIESANADVAKIDELNLLHIAASLGYLDLVKYLTNEKHATVDFVENRKYDLTPLQRAVTRGRLNVIRFLIAKKKANVDVRTFENENLLHLTLWSDNVEVMRYLLDEQRMFDRLYDRDTTSRHTVLMRAAYLNATKVIRFLIDDRNLSVAEKTDTGISLLHAAIASHNLKLVKYLVGEKGMDPYVRDNEGDTAYYFAAYNAKKYPEIFEYIRNRTINQG